MSLVFSAITPHPLFLIPAIGKDNIKKIDKTKNAFLKLEEDLYLSRPECLLIISPHGSYFSDAFTINSCPSFVTDLRDFGDLSTKLKFKGELKLASLIREASKDKDYSTAMISEPIIDHGSAVPLFYLTPHLPNVSILPIGFCDANLKTHVDFGYMIKEVIMDTNKRVAVIASGDLSQALSTDAPAGFNPDGAVFDQKIQELLSTGNLAGMLQFDQTIVKNATECGFRSFLILMGILKGIGYTYKSYSYESPFGVGYLTANLVLAN